MILGLIDCNLALGEKDMNPFQPPSEADLGKTVDNISKHSTVIMNIVHRLERIEGLLTDMLSLDEEPQEGPEDGDS
jgi:hypothetical protein